MFSYLRKGYSLFTNDVFKDIGNQIIILVQEISQNDFCYQFEQYKYPWVDKYPCISSESIEGLRYCGSSAFLRARNEIDDKLLYFINYIVKTQSKKIG